MELTEHSARAIRRRLFGLLPDGREVHEYTLDNGAGLTLSVLNLGGIVNALMVPDRHGRSANVVLGLTRLEDYVQSERYFGVIVGRYANRIAQGRIDIDGQVYELDKNDRGNCLHGGRDGFGTRLWSVTPLPYFDANGVGNVALHLRYTSAHGEQGFPGQLAVDVRYTLTRDHCWRIDYEARSDRPTVVNLSHHDYFNLAGSGSALQQHLTIHASRFNEVDQQLIPCGIRDVLGTPFDFRRRTPIAARIGDKHAQLDLARGYDHNWLLDHTRDGMPHMAARLEEQRSGRVMELSTTEPALQFYSGNFLDGSVCGHGDWRYARGDGICLEPQHSPDSPHHPDWPSTMLRQDEVYRSTSIYRFSVAVNDN